MKNLFKELLRNATRWFFDVRPLKGAGSIISVSLFFMFICFAIVGFRNSLFKTYFEVLVIFGLMIMFIYKADTMITNSNNGFFSVTLWLMVLLFIIGIVEEDYTLFLWSLNVLGVFIFLWVYYLIIKWWDNTKN